jgi:hypothetical protein
MNYAKTIVCFANSRKHSARCVAGKEWHDGRPGEWVRAVSDRQTHEVSAEERCYENGQEPQVLDIIRVRCQRPEPVSHQCENHVIDAAAYWVKQGRLPWPRILAWLDNPDALWSLGEEAVAGVNNRVSIGREEGKSLYLIAVPRLSLWVGRKAPTRPDSKRAVRGEFTYRGTAYRLDVTDPVVEDKYLAEHDGQYDIAKAVLCVSLGDPFEGYSYKLIASVFYRERFA